MRFRKKTATKLLIAIFILSTFAMAIPVSAIPVNLEVTGDGAGGFTLAEMDQHFSAATIDASAGDTLLTGSVTLGNFNLGNGNDVWYEVGLVNEDTYLGYSRLHNKGVYMIALDAGPYYKVHMQNVAGQTPDNVGVDNYLGNGPDNPDLWGDADISYFYVPSAEFDYEIRYHDVTTTSGEVDLRIYAEGAWSGWKLYQYAEDDMETFYGLTHEDAVAYGYAGDDDLTNARIVSQIFCESTTTATFTASYDNIQVDSVSYELSPRVYNIDNNEGYAGIQVAIDDADPYDTISVAAGTYDEQILVDKSLNIQGAGEDYTIIQPSGPGLTATTSIPWIGGGSGTMAAIVSVETVGGDVIIDDMTISGSLITTKSTTWIAGLVYIETSGTVESVTVIGNPTLPDRTAGIFAAAITETSSVEVTGCTVIGYNRAGIYALGVEFTADYHHNEINGPGTISTGVPNGMFFLEGAKGSATYNIVTDLGYTGVGEYRSTGIGTYNAGVDIEFSHNEISFVQNAFALSTGTVGTIVEYNDIHDCHTGVRIEAGATDSIIQYNDIHDNDFAIRCGSTMGDGNVANYNDFVDNLGEEWTNEDEAPPNTYIRSVCNVHTTYAFDATFNWWGTTDSGSIAAMISGDVLYDAWLPADFETCESDTDGDGFSYYDEVMLGTDPEDPNDYPGAEIILTVVGSVSGSGNFDATDEFDLGAEVDYDITAGDTMMTIAYYDGAPEDESSFSGLGEYIDVHVDDPSILTSTTITLHYDEADVTAQGLVESELRMYYWTGSAWDQCSNTGVDTGLDEIWAILDWTTTPDLDYLSGGPFGPGTPSPIIVLSPITGFATTITGDWFSVGNTVTIKWDATTMITLPTIVTVEIDGTFIAIVTALNSATGTYTISADDGAAPIAYATFTVPDMTGDPGATGLQGPKGATGSRGATGATGATGSQGETGTAGPQGELGPQGPAGNATIVQGEPGLQGELGSQGETGPAGVQGEPGPQGEQGLSGDQGPIGIQGLTGATGPQGVPAPAAVSWLGMGTGVVGLIVALYVFYLKK